ncbi:MAG: 8-amino-7-oxononanoate synthase [Planctomycetales bacterium]|nr:8-amino-7-oxononanoate synthase [Planctomycetales bacterium]
MPSDPLSWLDDSLRELERRNLRRTLLTRESPQRGDKIEIDGLTLANFGSNDYLGLASDERLCLAVTKAIEQRGWGSGASPLVTGRGSLHAQLESELARFEGTAAALLFSTGFAANVGAIASLTGPEDVIFSDAKNHASIIDGCRLSGAQIQVYKHGDVDDLRQSLALSHHRRKLIVTDTLFSMDGDLAPLPQIAQLAREHGAMFLVDEAHATGVFGKQGRGVCEHLGVEDGVHIRVGTLSKGLGSVGGFVAGSRALIDWLANRARPYVFSTAMPEAMAAAGLAALEIVKTEPFRRQELLQRAATLRESLSSAGLNIGRSESQIIPVILGSPARTMQAAADLRRAGFFVPGIRPPSVPDGESLLRISLSWLHQPGRIESLMEAIEGWVKAESGKRKAEG